MDWLFTSLVAVLLAPAEVRADAPDEADLILPSDPRFDVFELSNSAGGHTFASPHGTVLVSFVSDDQRYCRSARIPANRAIVLACREEEGWKIEASSRISVGEATNPMAFGGGMQQVGKAIVAMMASAEPLGELEVIEAARKGWRNPVPIDEQTLDARDILSRTARVYRASGSYADTGTVRTVYPTRSGDRTGETFFKTAYVAPHDFRFESTMHDFGTIEVNFVAWKGQDSVQTWFSVNPDLSKDITSIQSALDAGAGISRDSSGMIPGLIFPGTKLGGDIVRMTSAERLEDTQVDGFDCFQVRGFRWPNAGEPTTVWIDKQSFLIRRVYEERTIQGGTTKTTWFYDPAINVPVEVGPLAAP